MFWRKYPRWKPKKEGYYECVVQDGRSGLSDIPAIMILHYRHEFDRGLIWTNSERYSVFNNHKVYRAYRAAIDDNRVYADNLCERVDVVAWRKLPRLPRRWRKKYAAD